MRINQQTRAVTANGVLTSRKFTVSSNTHILNALANQYTYPIEAIVREYTTNMFDGHARLPDGSIVPTPEIHIPNQKEPYIEFRDYGVGMDLEFALDGFTAFGESTKRDSDTEAGSFGMGCKVAFAYAAADSWTVVSRHQGVAHSFVATRDDQGVPSFHHISSEPTVELSGVSVRIPVASGDFQRFREAVASFVKYCPMQLHVPQLRTQEIERPEGIPGDGWELTKDNTCRVIMGPVCYPVDMMEVGRRCLNVGDLWHRFSGAVLTVPIGGVDIPPTRETLQYTDRTCETVTAALIAMEAELHTRLQMQINDAPSYWDAQRVVAQLHQYWYAPYGIGEGFQWQGREVTGDHLTIAMEDLRKSGGEAIGYMITRDTKRGSHSQIITHASPIRLETSVWPHTPRDIWVLNTRDSALAAFRHYADTLPKDSKFIAFAGTGLTVDAVKLLTNGAPVSDFSEHYATYLEHRKTNRPVRRVPTQPKRTVVKMWSDAYFYSAELEATPDDTETKLYVPLSGQSIEHAHIDCDVALDRLLDTVAKVAPIQLMLRGRAIYGVPRTCRSVLKQGQWVNVLELIEHAVMQEWRASLPQQRSAASWQSERVERRDWLRNLEFLAQHCELVELPELQRLARDSVTASGALQHLSQINNVAVKLCIKLPEIKPPKHTAKELVDTLEAKYPLLNVIKPYAITPETASMIVAAIKHTKCKPAQLVAA